MSLLALLAAQAGAPPPDPDPILDTFAPVASTPRYSRLTESVAVDRTWQAPLTITAPAQELHLVYSSAHATGPAATIAAAVEVGGTVYPATFSGQPRAAITGAGASQWATGVVTLPAPLAAGTTIRVRTFATAGSVLMRGAAGQDGPQQYADGDLTVTGSGVIPVNPGIARSRITPVAVLGYTSSDVVSVAGLGDSIMEGGSDSSYEATPPGGGFFTRAARTTGTPAACFGIWADNFPANPATDRRYGGLLLHFTHAVCEYGTNALGDIALNHGGDWKILGARAITFWEWVAGQGCKIAQTTLTPKTSSTDGWTTVEGQSVATDGTEAVRLAFNAWVRDGCPVVSGAAVDPGTTGALRAGDAGHPLVDTIDTDAAVAATKTNGDEVFDVDPGGIPLTVDPAHPSPAGHARMAVPVAAWLNTLA